ncbi:unnamed protein product [Fusarium fujikuroi]|nr:hypothetical protein CEK25_011661 [Fusarium fujikuroi]VZI06347.1 unnamed protein product [Fusarium fujikuroi]
MKWLVLWPFHHCLLKINVFCPTLRSAILLLTLQAIRALNIDHAPETGHLRNSPARVTGALLGVICPLNLLLGNGPGLGPRAESEDFGFSITIAPDSTCGYVNRDKETPVTCLDTLVIYALGRLHIYIAYLQSLEAVNSTLCRDACQSNAINLLWQASLSKAHGANHFCRAYIYPSGIFDYRCLSTTVEKLEHVIFTYDGQKSPKFRIVTLADDVSEALGEPVERKGYWKPRCCHRPDDTSAAH